MASNKFPKSKNDFQAVDNSNFVRADGQGIRLFDGEPSKIEHYLNE